MMKTLRFCFALLLVASMFSPPEASAQTIIGAKAGINIANVTFSGDGVSASADSRTAFVGGAFAQFGIGSPWFIQPEVLYSSKGSKSDDVALKVDYLEVPVLLGAAFPLSNSALKPMVFAGPSVGFKLSCDEAGFDCSDEVKSVDFALVFGGGIQYALSSVVLFLDGRYNLGLTNVAEVEEIVEEFDFSAKNRTWQFMAGVGFPVGG
jgi:hypothetical protein